MRRISRAKYFVAWRERAAIGMLLGADAARKRKRTAAGEPAHEPASDVEE
jgi:hypothetical protein